MTIMLTPEQANVIADAALAQQRRELLESRNHRARRVSWVYQVPGLASREQYEQAEMLTAAERRAAKSVAYWCTAIGWLSLLALAWYWVAPQPALGLLVGAIGILGTKWVRFPFVRKQLAKLVAAASDESSDV